MTETLDIQITEAQASRLPEIDFDNLAFGKTFSDHMFIADYKNGEWTDLTNHSLSGSYGEPCQRYATLCPKHFRRVESSQSGQWRYSYFPSGSQC